MPEDHMSATSHTGAKPALEYSTSNYILTVVSSWLVPGAGFWMLGYRARAVVFFTTVMALFWGGQALADFRAVNRDLHPVFFVGQVGNGLSTLLSEYTIRRRRPPRIGHGGVARNLPAHLSTGLNFTTISGLLNVLLILHVADPRTWRGDPPPRPGGGSRDGSVREDDGE